MQLIVSYNKAINGSQVGHKFVTIKSQVGRKCSQECDNKTTSWSLFGDKCITRVSQVSNNKFTNGYCDSKVANTDWLIPLVA